MNFWRIDLHVLRGNLAYKPDFFFFFQLIIFLFHFSRRFRACNCGGHRHRWGDEHMRANGREAVQFLLFLLFRVFFFSISYFLKLAVFRPPLFFLFFSFSSDSSWGSPEGRDLSRADSLHFVAVCVSRYVKRLHFPVAVFKDIICNFRFLTRFSFVSVIGESALVLDVVNSRFKAIWLFFRP